MNEIGYNNNANNKNDDHKMIEMGFINNIANNKNYHGHNMSEMGDDINIVNNKNDDGYNINEMGSSYPYINFSSLNTNSHTFNSLRSDHFTQINQIEKKKKKKTLFSS